MTIDLFMPTVSLVAQFAGGDQELSDRVRHGFNVKRGSSQPSFTGLVADAGALDSLDVENFDGALDPTNVASAFYPDLVPGVRMKLTLTWDAVDYVQFLGPVDGWDQMYGTAGLDQIVVLTARDAVSTLGQAQLSGSFPRQLSGARIAAVLTAAGFAGASSIDPGTAMLPAIADAGGRYAWTLIADAVAAEWGYGFANGPGDVVFLDRNGLAAVPSYVTPLAIFGDRPDLGELPYDDTDMPFNKDRILNDANLNYNDHGDTATAEDAVSKAQPWGPLPWRQSIPMASGPLAHSYVTHLVHQYGNPSPRISFLKVKPQDAPAALWPLMLGLEPGQMFTVKKTPQGGGARIELDVFVRSVEHDLIDNDWTTIIGFDDSDLVSVGEHFGDAHLLDGSLILSF